MAKRVLKRKPVFKKEFIKAIKAATRLLRGTPYQRNKKIISSLFDKARRDCKKEVVCIRLRVIDSCYSTNLRMNPGAFDVLAKLLIRYRADDFVQLMSRWKDRGVGRLFSEKIGRRKSRQPSVVSKYAYFLTKHKFPIYDSLVLDGYKLLKKNRLLKRSGMKVARISRQPKEYFDALNNLRFEILSSKISYDQLDQFFWLWGQARLGRKAAGWLGLSEVKQRKFKIILENLKLPLRN